MTHPTDDSLKPCPFCGAGTTEITPNGRMWTGMKYSEPSSVSVRHWCEAVPGQPSRMIERVGRDEASAIAAWNTRALLAEPETNRDWSQAQDWKGMDGTTAFHLIQRHANGWGDVGAMMNAWLAANAAQPLKAEQAKDAAEDAELLEDERATEASRLITALANCRDAFPIPEHGSPLERAWAEAMADPLAVPHYIRAARAAERKA